MAAHLPVARESISINFRRSNTKTCLILSDSIIIIIYYNNLFHIFSFILFMSIFSFIRTICNFYVKIRILHVYANFH